MITFAFEEVPLRIWLSIMRVHFKDKVQIVIISIGDQVGKISWSLTHGNWPSWVQNYLSGVALIDLDWHSESDK